MSDNKHWKNDDKTNKKNFPDGVRMLELDKLKANTGKLNDGDTHNEKY